MKSVVDQERLSRRLIEWKADWNVKRPGGNSPESDDSSAQTTTDDDADVPVQVCDDYAVQVVQ